MLRLPNILFKCFNRNRHLATSKFTRYHVGQFINMNKNATRCQMNIWRWTSSQHSERLNRLQQLQEKDTEGFKAIYHLPYIKHLRLLSRLKLAQTIFVVGIVPPLGIMNYMDLITNAQFLYPACAATFALAMLYWMSFYLRRIIGIIYINQNRSKLKVAHLNFWGHRQEFVVDVKDVLSNLDIGDSKQVQLRKFQTFKSKQCLYYALKYGNVLDEEIFYEIFGKPK